MLRRFKDLADTEREELLAKNLSELAEIASDSTIVISTRYNAVLAIGQLDAKPGNPPVAYLAALTTLIDFYQQADFPNSLRCGALLGIVRHALCGVDPSQRDKVIDMFLETAMAEIETGHAVPLEPAVWDWFRCTSLDGLAAMKTTGANGKVAAELLALINRKSLEIETMLDRQDMFTLEAWKQLCRTIELASKAAKTLGDLDYSSATGIDTKKMTDSFIRLTLAVCDIQHKMAAEYIELEKTVPAPALLLEQIVMNVKIGVQSIVWGMRSGLLSAKPSENSFYLSLKNEDTEIKRLDTLMAEIVELSAFLDEGDKTKRTPALPNMPKAFKFDLAELRDALKKCSESLAKITVEHP
jgi:hypothetical protein